MPLLQLALVTTTPVDRTPGISILRIPISRKVGNLIVAELATGENSHCFVHTYRYRDLTYHKPRWQVGHIQILILLYIFRTNRVFNLHVVIH